jgi:hypothetical protein
MSETRVEIPAALGIGGPLVQVTKSRIDKQSGLPVPAGRTYELGWLSDQPEVASVTTIVDGQLRNRGLEWWREDWIRSGLRANEGKTVTAAMSASILGAANAEANASAAVGSRIHGVIDSLLRGEACEYVGTPIEPAIRGFLDWRNQHREWEFLGSEIGVWCHDPVASYAGTIDALFLVGDGLLVACDWKTSSGIYESAAMQVAAYAYALEQMVYVEGQVKANQNGHPSSPLSGMELDEFGSTWAVGMIVRLDNSYPLTPQGRKDRTKPKIFSGAVETAQVTVEDWFPPFLHCLGLHTERQQQLNKTYTTPPEAGRP